MKHRFIAAVSVAATAMTLAACAPDPLDEEASPSPSVVAPVTSSPAPTAELVEADAFLSQVEWKDNGDGVAPELTFPFPVNFSTTGSELITDGTGATIDQGQLLEINYVAYYATDGAVFYSTYELDSPEYVQLNEANFDEGLLNTLTGAKVGADIVFLLPDTGNGAIVMAMTITDVVDVLDRATGTAVPPVAGLPTVTLSETGQPTVSTAGLTMPTTLVSQDLITGTGAVVTEGQTLMVHYSGWVWGSSTTFDSSWDRGESTSFPFVTGGLIQGWIDGLEGKTVGSQVLLVIPADLAYGAEDKTDSLGNVTIPANSTLVFVVDILAAY